MAENQTATEDSGQQSQQHQQTQQQQQPQSPQQEQPPPALISPTTPPQDNSPSSPEDTQTIVIPHSNYHLHHSLHHNQHSGQMQEQPQSRSMIDRQISSKFKTSSTSSQRRNTIQTPTRTTSTTAIKKPALTKMTSLTSGNTSGSVGDTSVGMGTGVANMNAESSKHHHYHHQHIHQHHNNTPNHHHSPSSGGGNSGSGSGSTNAVQRRTSESLRLHTSLAGGSTGESSTSNVSNTTSNSSLHSNLNLSNNSTSSSTSVAPHSTTTTATATASTSKATSPNNNGGSNSTTSRGHHSHGHHHAASQPNRKPKTTSSFQITSVTVGHPKVQSDNGDESADDLDESHTDDNSRVTDLETEPSISEDTFSKEEVYFANSALSTTAPVIPTSSQYGLVVVDPVGPTLGQSLQNVQVNVAENIINVVSAVTPGGSKKKDDGKEGQQRSERFKVVKIESTEPFRRGRWMCMDYLDHSTVGIGGKEGNGGNNNEKTASSESGSGANGESAKTTQSMIIGSGAATLLENHIDAAGNSLQLSSSSTAADGNWNFMEGTQNALQHQMSAPSGIATAPATVVHGMQQFVENTGGTGKGGSESGTQQGQETQNQQQQQQPVYPDCANANTVQEVTHGQTMPMDYATAAAQQLQKSLQELKKREEAIAASEEAGTIYVPNQQQPTTQHGATLPSNLHFQNGSVAIPSDLSNSTNNPTQAQQPPSEQQTTEQPQPPMTPALQNSQQSAPQSGAFNQKQNFQSAQQTQQQSSQMIPTDVMGLAAPQQQQQTQASPQLQPQPTSQTDGAVPTMANVSSVQQQPQQQHPSSQFQQSASGQTMPIMSQMTNYDMQQQQQATATTLPDAQSPPHMQQSAPATIADTNAIATAIQQQQQQKLQVQTQPAQIENPTLTTTTGKVTNESQSQQLQSANILNNISVSANSNNNAASKPIATVNTTTTPLSNTDEQQMTNQQPPHSSQLQQLQQNTETETESFSSLSQALAYGTTRKRAFSTPHISPVIMSLLNTSANNVRGLVFKNKNKSNSNNSAHQQIYDTKTAAEHKSDNTYWPGQRSSDSKIYTNLAMGDSRYKLTANPSELDVDYGNDGEEEEAIDQFSPTIYPSSRAIPIPIISGNSPQHLSSGQQTPQLPSPTHLAYSTSPTTSGCLYSPFYNDSPEGPTPPVPMPRAKMSYSYDTAFGAAFNRLLTPRQQPTLPLIPGQQEGAAFAAFATSPTSSLNSASGTSAVAIDNKIEQAMDLVKSHLMIAVREEVEVLKEKISELMDKINQLEVENTILKANMPQETLQQLQMQTQLQIAGNSANTPAATTAVVTNNLVTTAQTPTPAPVQQQQPTVTPTTLATESDANNTSPTAVAAPATAVTTSVNSGNNAVATATTTINGPLPSS